MVSTTLTFPRTMLLRLADMFHERMALAPQSSQKERETSSAEDSHLRANQPVRSKLNISLEDLKIISTALLYYKRNLAKMGEMERASDVARIDEKFYQLISLLEAQQEEEEGKQDLNAAA